MSNHPFQNFMRRYGAGETIFEDGEQGKTMFIVQSGGVHLSRAVDGKEQPLGLLEKGDFFGEMSILEGLPRTCTARAEGDAELIEINSMIFDKMIRGNIEIAIRMLRKLSIRLRESERKIAEYQAHGVRPPSATSTTAAAPKVTRKAACTGARLESPDQTAAYVLLTEETLIGRYDPVTELRPDIDLTDLDLKRSVSRRHARIVNTDAGYLVMEEVGALNGTFINGEKLVTGEGHPLAEGDSLALGTVNMVFRT